MNTDRYSGLSKAYSSALSIEWHNGKEVIIKHVDAQERESELFFQAQLQQIGLPSMDVSSDPRGLAIAFIPDAQTLGDQETPEQHERLGRVLRKLHSRDFDSCFYFDKQGNRQRCLWDDFLMRALISGTNRQKKMQGFSRETVEQIEQRISLANLSYTEAPKLVHGDLHANNVLIHKTDLYLFDVADRIMTGDPLYDLSLFAITLPGAVFGVGSEVERDQKLMQALIRGYEFDFTVDRDRLEAFVLLRSLERYPNPFEPEIQELVNHILTS